MNRIPGFRFDGINADFSYLAKDRQTLSVTDLLSEGPIYGLVDGAASVYLNDDRAVPLSEASSYYSQSAATAALTNGATGVTISGAGAHPIIESAAGTKYLIVRAGHGGKQVTASNGSAGTDNFAITATLTTQNTDSFFTAGMVSSPADVDTHVPARLGIIASGGIGDGAFGEGWIVKRTSNSVAEFVPGSASGPSGLWIPDGNYFLEVDRIVEISAISGTTVILASAWTGVTGSYKFDVTGAIVSEVDVVTQSQTTNHEGVTTQFRVGTLAQTPFSGRGGNGSTSISNSPSGGGALEHSNNYGGDQDPKVLIGTSNAGFKLTASQAQEVDEARFTIAYPNGHFAVSNGGKDKFTHTQYRTMIAVKKPGESSFENFQVLKHPLTHSSMDKNSVSFVETVDLTMFRPFSDFKIQVERISDHEGDAFEQPGVTYDGWTQVTASSLTNTTCVIKDILTHPFSAMANVSFDTKKFQGLPTRSYHLRGLKVSVPSNYVTREQTSEGVASYNRNITSGAITTSYQDWDGAFASEKVYTNNPAWVFYDILTNNRYGLGDFLKDTDIDKYALYRISRYCDALVDDGKGGLEPRFTANLYFTKAADAYKVLKDIATVFRSMLYYIDGKVVPIIDAPSGPVYNFTKANVIEGKFAYEGTGSKTRINQCIVTWIDPEANYKASPLIVEDRLNIAKTGTIISQSAMAMGATSEGQALRYGRWKLWTAANQREIASFSTALNATFLMPGDIINIQDADRYAVRIGGRVSNSGTDRSTSSIPLDSTTNLISGSTYKLSVMFVEPGAFRTEDVYNTSTPPVKIHSKGDLVKQAFIDSNNNGTYTLQNIDTETKAINAKATATGTDALVLSWSETTRVETQDVTASLIGNSVDTITVTTAFSAIPPAESIWVLTETVAGQTVLGSAKEYKVLAISQNSKNEFAITAVEHYDEKFSAVDEDFTTYIADSVYPAVRHNDVVPPVTDVYATSMMNPNFTGEELTIQWSPPRNVGPLEGNYEHLAGYEISHDFTNVESPIVIENSNQTTFKIEGVEDGTYNIAIKTINILQNVSVPTVSVVRVSDKYKENIPRLPLGVPYGGTTSVGFGLISSSFTFQNYQYSVKHPSDKAALITNTNTSSAAWQQSCSNLPVISWTESNRNSAGQFIDEHAYILVDASDSTDRLKLLKYHKPALSVPFWYDMGSGNATNKYGSALTGTFSKGVGTTKVTGSGTAFLTQIKDGDVLKLGSTEGYKVAAVVSDTLLYVTNNFSSFSGVQGFIPNIRIDYANDVIIARVYRTSAGLIIGEVYSKLDSVLKKAKNIVEEDGIEQEQIAEDAVGTTEIDTSSETGGTFGAAVAALDSASFTSIDTAVLNADSVIAREVQVFPTGGTAPTISGTTLAGAGIDLKQDGDMYVGNAAANKYMFWDQSEGTMTFRGTLDVDDIVGSSATFGTLMAEVATIGTLNTEMLDSDAIVTRDIRVGPSVETNAGSFATGTEYYITVLGNTTQAQWNSVAGTSGVVYNLGSIFTAANAGTGTGKARNRTTVAKIAGATLTGTGAHLNSDGDFYVGNASANKYMFWDQSAGTMQIRGTLDASDITAGTISAARIAAGTITTDKITVNGGLSALTADLGDVTAGTLKGGNIPDANDAPGSSEAGAFFDLGAGKFILGNQNKYIWWNGANLTLNGVTISDSTLGNVAGVATEDYVDDAITALLDGAPDALNTLNELAASIADNSNFAGAMTTSLGGKVGTGSAQALSTAANALTISGSTISLVRANGDTDTVAVPNDNTQYTAGSGLTLSGTEFSNPSPDRVVSLTGVGATSISGTYPSFTITSANDNTQRSDEEIRDVAASIMTAGSNITIVKDDNANTVTINSAFSNTQRTDEEIRDLAAGILTAGTNVSIVKNDAANTATISSTNTQYTAGSGLSLSGTQFSNSAPDRTVALTGAGGATISGTYPNFTITTANTVFTHPAYTPRSINTSGATVLDTFTSDAIGSVTGIGTRTLTLADLGYTGATNANRITDNSQIANGRNFTTNTGTTTASNTQTFTNKSGDISQWTNDSAYVTSSGNTIIGTDSDINTSGALVVDQLNMTDGVIQSHSTRTLTLANLGYTGATDANKYVLPFANNSSNWNTAYGWGDHGDAGYLTSQTSHADVVVDGNFTSNGILKRTSAGNYGIVTDNSNNWNTAYGWGDHGDEGYQLASADAANATQLGGYAASLYVKNTDFASASTGGVIKIGYTESGKNYPVELSSNKAYVNVPWQNTVYTHPASTARNINTSGAQVIDVFTSNAIGSVTNVTTRTMTLADLGLTNNSSNWNTAYNNHITGVGVSGTTTKTITLTQQDGGTLTANWADLNGSNDFVDSLAFNTSNGILTVGRTGSLSDLTVDLDGRFVTSSGNTIIGTDSDISATGSTVISAINMTDGVIQSHSTRTLTLGDLGFSAYSHPNHSGDVTSSGDGAQTIASNAVTFAKMQDIATDTFMGRTASGSGDAKALSVSEARTMLNVENGATADQSAAQILAALKTVDVNGTAGINAGTFDGLPGANIPKFYNNAVLTDSASTTSFIAELASDYGCFGNNQVTLKVQWSYAGSSNLVTGHATIGTLELAGCTIETWGGTYKHVRITRPNTGTGGHMVVEYNDQSSGYSPGWREIWTSESDGAGSGLDADKLDGQQGTHYLAYANFTGTPSIPSGNQVLDWTADQGSKEIHPNNYINTTTNYFLNSITKSGNELTFGVSGATNQSYTFGSNAFTSTAIPTGNAIIDWTASNAGTIHSSNYINTQYVAATSSAFGLIKVGFTTNAGNRNYKVELSGGNAYVNVPWANDNTPNFNLGTNANGNPIAVTSGSSWTFQGTGGTSITRSGTAFQINTTNPTVSGSGLSQSGLVFSHSNTSNQASVNNSGRTYIQDITLDEFGHITNIASATETVTDSNTWNANSRTVAGYVAAPGSVANQVWKTDGSGNPAWRADAEGSSGVTTVQAGTNVNAISVSGGTTATATLSAHATLEAIADGVAVSNLDVDFLKADTIVANKITANTIDAGKLTVGNSSSSSANRLLLLEDSLKIFSGSTLRVHIGNLANTDDGT